jgi:hypothetical protein
MLFLFFFDYIFEAFNFFSFLQKKLKKLSINEYRLVKVKFKSIFFNFFKFNDEFFKNFNLFKKIYSFNLSKFYSVLFGSRSRFRFWRIVRKGRVRKEFTVPRFLDFYDVDAGKTKNRFRSGVILKKKEHDNVFTELGLFLKKRLKSFEIYKSILAKSKSVKKKRINRLRGFSESKSSSYFLLEKKSYLEELKKKKINFADFLKEHETFLEEELDSEGFDSFLNFSLQVIESFRGNFFSRYNKKEEWHEASGVKDSVISSKNKFLLKKLIQKPKIKDKFFIKKEKEKKLFDENFFLKRFFGDKRVSSLFSKNDMQHLVKKGKRRQKRLFFSKYGFRMRDEDRVGEGNAAFFVKWIEYRVQRHNM